MSRVVMKILIIITVIIVSLIFGAVGAWAGLVLTASNGTIRDRIAMTILCPTAESFERKDFSGGTVGHGSSAKGSKVFEYTCKYADGRQEIIYNDRAVLTAFAGGTVGGAIGGILMAIILSVGVILFIRKANQKT